MVPPKRPGGKNDDGSQAATQVGRRGIHGQGEPVEEVVRSIRRENCEAIPRKDFMPGDLCEDVAHEDVMECLPFL